MPDLPDVLRSLGLEPLEVKTYLLLLRTGAMQAGEMAGKLGTPRSSLYGVLKRLKDRGLAHEVVRRSVKWFSAERPERFTLLFRERMEELRQRSEQFEALLPELHRPAPRRAVRPRLQLFEGT